MQVNFSSPTAAQFATQAGESQGTNRSGSTNSSTLSSGSESKGFCSTVLDIVTYIPLKIWGFIQWIVCCCPSEPLPFADQIKKDPETAAKKTIELLDQRGFDEGIKSVRKALANFIFNPENDTPEAQQKLAAWIKAIAKAGKADYAKATSSAISHLTCCYKLPGSIATNPQLAAKQAIETLEAFGYEDGKAYLLRGFATIDPKTPEGKEWVKLHGKKFEKGFANELIKIVLNWGDLDNEHNTESTPVRKAIFKNLDNDLAEIMKPFKEVALNQ